MCDAHPGQLDSWGRMRWRHRPEARPEANELLLCLVLMNTQSGSPVVAARTYLAGSAIGTPTEKMSKKHGGE